MFSFSPIFCRERALLEAASRSQAIIEFALDGTIRRANGNFLTAMGYELAEIQGKHHSLFVEPREAQSAAYRDFWEALRRGEYRSAEFRRLAKGGREVWIQASYTPVLNRRGKPIGVVKFATDVTEAKRRAIADGAQIASIHRSQAVIHFRMDGVITQANDIFLQMMGYALHEVVGQSHRMCVTPEHASSGDYERFWAGLRRGEFQRAEYKRLGKGGREVWILATYTPVLGLDGTPVEVIKFATDITASKLRTADFEGQIDAINKSQAVIHFDMEGRVLQANRNFLRAMGYAEAEVVGRHHSMFIEPELTGTRDYEEFWAKLRRGDFHSAVYKRIGKGGRVVWISATYNPILDLNGRPCKVVKYASDITARMQSRAEAITFAGQTLSNVQSVAAAVEQMSASAAQISETMRRSQAVVQDITRKASDADQATRRLQEAAAAMDRVVQLIRTIASQISLLSLNATIESARAGEAGKGFAVVAHEVKQLANQTTAATQQVAENIEAMQSVSAEVGTALNAIAGSVAALLDYVGAAVGAVEEQGNATQEISSNMQAASVDVAGITRSLSADRETAA
ncbi:histidine kinase [Pseudoroseomonas deserti]|uniref:Histidine kinase n=1 Tax=Teichococcus deserti TaxID=1817963 RepID=A0A1V2GW43_9PROT|nr:PAS domain-containing methyl-accepting chemotaxis protein [Pseudoroseomonas deserti]ONG47359.1 histidine kinase [Pseudoroseomonas deserti]